MRGVTTTAVAITTVVMAVSVIAWRVWYVPYQRTFFAHSSGRPQPSNMHSGSNGTSHMSGGLWVGAATNEWAVELELFSPEVTAPRAGGYCSAVPKRRHRDAPLATIRAVPRRIIIDERCRPNYENMDAGVCVQTDVGRGRRAVGCLPSLVIVGFQKCATAELQSWLSAHPALLRWQGDIDQRSGAGEPDFFKVHGASALAVDSAWMDRYVRAGLMLRRPSDAQTVYTFEKSPNYGSGMPRTHVAQLRRLLPSVKIIAMVREPAARAYSGFQHSCKKGRVFQIDADIPRTSRNTTRRHLRSSLAGRVLIANSRTEAEEGLRRRFGTYSIYKEYILPLEYPCPPATFSNFLGLERVSAALLPTNAARGNDDEAARTTPSGIELTIEHLLKRVLDFRDGDNATAMGLTSVVSHGFYAEHLEAFLQHFPATQVQSDSHV